jgi:hypothetical protein
MRIVILSIVILFCSVSALACEDGKPCNLFSCSALLSPHDLALIKRAADMGYSPYVARNIVKYNEELRTEISNELAKGIGPNQSRFVPSRGYRGLRTNPQNYQSNYPVFRNERYFGTDIDGVEKFAALQKLSRADIGRIVVVFFEVEFPWDWTYMGKQRRTSSEAGQLGDSITTFRVPVETDFVSRVRFGRVKDTGRGQLSIVYDEWISSEDVFESRGKFKSIFYDPPRTGSLGSSSAVNLN